MDLIHLIDLKIIRNYNHDYINLKIFNETDKCIFQAKVTWY